MTHASTPATAAVATAMHFDYVLAQSPIGIAVINEAGVYEAVNPAYSALYGYSNDELLGQNLEVILPPQAREQIIGRHRAFLTEQIPFDGELDVVRRDGTPLRVLVKSARVEGADGVALRLVYVSDITERCRVECALQESRAFTQSVLDSLQANICVIDESGRIIAVNQAWRDFCHDNHGEACRCDEGVSCLNACNCGSETGTHSAECIAPLLQELLAGTRESFEATYPCHSPGEQRWFLARATRVRESLATRIVVAHHNITRLKQAEEELKAALHFSENLIASMQDGFSVLDIHGVSRDANPALCAMTGFSRDELVGRSAPFPYWPPEAHGEIQRAFVQTLRGEPGSFELTFMKKTGERFPVIVSASSLRDDSGRQVGFIATVKDITDRKAMEEQIRRYAFYDTLTGLPNRRLLDDRLGHAMAASKRSGRFGAAMFIDLDNFKPLNDAHGHGVGDLLLAEAAARLRACTRQMDTVARFGGDEFVVVLKELNGDADASAASAHLVAEKIRGALSTPYRLIKPRERGSDQIIEHRCTASVGIMLFMGQETSASDILKFADQAMYDAKAKGRDAICIHAHA
ncbi:bifunctional diguanylate cyclase/phosphodiesterase [Niveibacterium umoris]|uniref:Diguanylate cyclase (GGDEF)-like protein/PAS domain S-box-containing protein n=1 Tax=Niveibacterium umoris TaxID=1193620 RepID=A0A840BP77_9RHOO|nr:PAS domain S-box protein [Niveibacterium umoris]MBB4013328.1 diguanylate cyclase (GGDEF)-like protein/PAS domain S-box-containing protein [Niveibacterium umoris]